MKKTVLLSAVLCIVLGLGGFLRAENDDGIHGTARERFQALWKRRDFLGDDETNNPIYILYWVALQDVIAKKMSARNLVDRDRFMTLMRAEAAEAGVTNITPYDLEHVYELYSRVMGVFIIGTNLPVRIEDWPPPDMSWTNPASGISEFIKENGWSMYRAPMPFLVGLQYRTEPITGVPWTDISSNTYSAVTYDEILFIVLSGFGADSLGVAWNPRANSFPGNITGFTPLGRGWYAWHQSDQRGNKQYEGEGQPGGGAIGTQTIRSDTNSLTHEPTPVGLPDH